jgi:peptide/nickel transport system substrate-binding protein
MRQAANKSSFYCMACVALLLAGCQRGSTSAHAASVPGGGEATILLDAGYAGSWPTGLDPATDTTARANLSMMNAIFGGLFQIVAEPDGSHARVAGVLATGYQLEDEGRTFVINLREGVRFSDGTPFDAEAVRFNVERSRKSACTCAPTSWPWAQSEPVTVTGPHTVKLHFSQPYGAVVDAFPNANVNWIASPTALARMGPEQFRITPVGAGPFRIVSDQLSSRLVLERNPQYWQRNQPYLARLIFRSIGSEQAALQALLAGDAHAYEGMTSTPLIELARKQSAVTVTLQPPTAVYVIQLNTLHAPFNDLRAREAIYYATDVDAIRRGLFHSWYPASQSFTGPGGLFHHDTIPGYRTFDIARARTLVAELGGIRVKLGTLRSFVAEQVMTALQAQWQAAGIQVSIDSYELSRSVQLFRSGEWQAMLQTAGSFDPEAAGGVSWRFRSDQPYSGVHDGELDRLLLEAAASFDPSVRDSLYLQAGKRISDNAYAPFLFAFAPAQVAVKPLEGPGLTSGIPPLLVNTAVLWQDVKFASNH